MGFRAPLPDTEQDFDLCTLAFAKLIIGGFENEETGDEDNRINYLIHACSKSMANTVCNHQFKYAEYTYYEDGDGSTKLFLPDWPIDLGQDFKLWIGRDYDGDFDDDYLMTRWEDYVVDAGTGIVKVYGNLPEGLQNIKCTYTGGYQAGQVPYDLQMGTALWVADIYMLPADRRHGVVNKSREGWNMTVAMNPIPEKALLLVQKYINGADG